MLTVATSCYGFLVGFKLLAEGEAYLHNCSPLVQKLNSSALLNGGTSAPLLAIYCWQRLICQDAKLSNMW